MAECFDRGFRRTLKRRGFLSSREEYDRPDDKLDTPRKVIEYWLDRRGLVGKCVLLHLDEVGIIVDNNCNGYFGDEYMDFWSLDNAEAISKREVQVRDTH